MDEPVKQVECLMPYRFSLSEPPGSALALEARHAPTVNHSDIGGLPTRGWAEHEGGQDPKSSEG